MAVTKDVNLLLAESLKALTEKKAIEKITIKEITDKAGVIRPTFYNHFQDKYELLEWIIKEQLLNPCKPLMDADMFTEAMVLLFTNIKKDSSFYNKAVKMEGPVTFHEVAMKCVSTFLKEMIGTHEMRIADQFRWLPQDVIVAYYAQSMSFAAEQWIIQGMQVPPRQMAETYYFLLTHSLWELLKKDKD